MKIALITDTHFGARNDSLLFIDFFRKFYENIFFPTLKERGITDVIHLGDVVDRRKFINYKTLNSMKEILFSPLKEMGGNIKIIVGNHDIYYKNTLKVNSMEELTKGMDHVTVYSDPCEVSLTKDHKVLFLPWICADNEDKSKELIEKTRTKVAFGHLQIVGIEQDKGSFAMEGSKHSKECSLVTFIIVLLLEISHILVILMK
jgi:predicted phosphodiesterase